MVLVKLSSLDRNADFRKGKVPVTTENNKESKDEGAGPLIVMPPGDYTLGRGQFLKCFDQRVSRKHARLMVTEDKATLLSTHVNPCFFSSFGSRTVVTLKKDMEQELKDGDRFSLLPSEFWYKVKLCNVNDEVDDTDMKEIKLKVPETAEVGSTTEDGPPTTSAAALPEETDSCQPAASSTVSKRKHPEDRSAEPSSKHPRLNEEEEIKEENTERPHETVELSEDDNIVLRVRSSESSDEKSVKEEQEEVVQPAEEQDQMSVEIIDEPVVDVVDDRESDKLLCNGESTTDNGNETQNETTVNICNDENTDEDRKTPVLNRDTEIKSPILNGGDVNNVSANLASNPNVVNDGAGPSSSRPRRERCWFTDRCYRKNPSHKTDFSHPGDDDYDSDPNDSRPICSYGLSCYRRNLQHRRQYRHLAPPAPRPNQDQRKRKRKATTRVTNYKDDTPEDDYDYDDPFLNDGSSDDYEEESDFSMSDSDSEDDSQATEDSEDVRRLVKEAKKFQKK